MDKYSFDKTINRRGTNCAKWDTFDRLIDESDLIHVGCADTDFKAPQKLLERLHEVVEHGVFGYSDLFDDFYDAIVRFYKVHHDVCINPEHIVFCPRINIACGLLAEAITRPYDEIVIHSPSYTPLRQSIEENGRHLIEVPLHKRKIYNKYYDRDYIVYDMNINDLEKVVCDKTKMLILVNPHNPTTKVFTRQELIEIAEFCLKHDIAIFADEIHSDLIAPGIKFTTILSLDEKYRNHIVLASSPAKTFNIPGLVGSFLVIPNDRLRASFKNEISRIGEHNPNVFFNAALTCVYNDCDSYIEDVKDYINENATYFINEFMKAFPKAHIAKREGSYLLWIDLSNEFESEDDIRNFFFHKAKVGVYLGSQFSLESKKFIRFNLGCSKFLLQDVFNRINKVLKT